VSKHVLFDLDGTLLDTAQDFTHVLNQLLQEHGRQTLTHDAVRETVSDGARALIRRGFQIDEQDPNFQQYSQALLDRYADQINQTQSTLFAGIDTLLQDIAARQFQWGIVTNKPSRFTEPLLRHFPSMQHSATVICADQLRQRKPDPEGLLQACRIMDCNPSDCIYIGDHPRDIQAGKNANMPTIAVGWGYFPAGTQLEYWQADFIAETPIQISQYLFGN
jgi:2-phosphoglycolate phosphatase